MCVFYSLQVFSSQGRNREAYADISKALDLETQLPSSTSIEAT